jgi:DNA-binding transcriptional ArsR family regulator
VVPGWTLVTSHGLVLLYVSVNSHATIREISERLGLTERRIADIIRDLAKAGLLRVRRKGRKNEYALAPEASFRHPIMTGLRFDEFVALFLRRGPAEPSPE